MEPRNDFQALMRNWTALGPYNAIHLVRLAGAANPERWREAAATPVSQLGFAALGPVEKKTPGLAETVRAELNRPCAGNDPPLRFFVIDEPDGTHWFGLTFNHWIADSQSIRFLMRRIFANYMEPGSAAALPPMRHCDTPFDVLFGKANRFSSALEGLQKYLRHRRAFRAGIPDPLDFTAGFQFVRLPGGLIDRIRETAKTNGCSVNDVFVAAAAQTMGRLTAAERAGKRRRLFSPARNQVAISVVSDIRPFSREPLDEVFGFYLSYYTALASAPELETLAGLSARISTQTKAAKSMGRTLLFFHGFKIANAWWNACRKPWQRALMFHKAVPVLGAVSNVNLTDSWIGREGRVLEYVRVSPAGPLAPVVFTLTTLGNRLTLCVTHRTTIFSNKQAAAIAEEIAGRLQKT